MCNKGKIAKELFEKGYNCCQAVLLAYCDELGLDKELAAKLASSFGGGMGGMGETCGAVTGMFMVAGLMDGYTFPENPEEKAMHNKYIRELANKFKNEKGSLICRELKSNCGGLKPREHCAMLVEYAANLLDK